MSERLFAPSDPLWHPSDGAPKSLSAVTLKLGDARPHLQEAPMPASTGRPTAIQSAERRREFLRRLAAGDTSREAARKARMKADAVLTALDEQEFRTVVFALLDGRADTVAVTVAPEPDTLAA